MGVDVCGINDDHAYTIQGGRRAHIEPAVYPSRFDGRSSEIYLRISNTENFSNDGETPAPARTNCVEVRIYGVTVRAMIDEMVKDEQLFRYLSSAVDHLRANPGAYKS